jgi:hypothetical protein
VSPWSRRHGYSLVEIAVAVGVVSLLLYALVSILVSGSRLFSGGVGATRGPEGALIVMDEIERDLLQCMQLPGDPRAPVAVGDGHELALYVPRATDDLRALAVIGQPVHWNLVPVDPKKKDGPFHPARNDRVLRSVVIDGWDFELLPPSEEEARYGWYVSYRVTIAAESKVDRPFLAARLMHLAQPSSNFLHFPGFGGSLRPGRVLLLPRPPAEVFAGLGPPDGANP